MHETGVTRFFVEMCKGHVGHASAFFRFCIYWQIIFICEEWCCFLFNIGDDFLRAFLRHFLYMASEDQQVLLKATSVGNICKTGWFLIKVGSYMSTGVRTTHFRCKNKSDNFFSLTEKLKLYYIFLQGTL